MTWSAGITSNTASAASEQACSAARVSAGAVFRPAGSRTMWRVGYPAERICSAVMKRYSSLHTILVAHDDGLIRHRHGAGKALEPACSRLQHGVIPGERQELLGILLARKRP